MADRERTRPSYQERERLLAALAAAGPAHVVDAGTLGEYAQLLASGGPAMAARELPDVASHLADGCAACAADLAELAALLADPDDARPTDDTAVPPADLRPAARRSDADISQELVRAEPPTDDAGREARDEPPLAPPPNEGWSRFAAALGGPSGGPDDSGPAARRSDAEMPRAESQPDLPMIAAPTGGEWSRFSRARPERRPAEEGGRLPAGGPSPTGVPGDSRQDAEAARRARLRKTRDILLLVAAAAILLMGLSLVGLAYVASSREPARLTLTPVPTEAPGASPGAGQSRPSAPPAAAPAATPSGPAVTGGAAVPTGMDCPASHPIKGNRESMIYHPPEGAFYRQTRPEACFATPVDAEAAGYRRSQR